MDLSVKFDILIISLILSAVFLFLFALIMFRWYLSRKNKYLNKNYTALLINFNEMIEMKIPFIQQADKQEELDQYSRTVQTETYHLCENSNSDFYRSILSKNELPYYPVRETVFHTDRQHRSQRIIDSAQDNSLDTTRLVDV